MYHPYEHNAVSLVPIYITPLNAEQNESEEPPSACLTDTYTHMAKVARSSSLQIIRWTAADSITLVDPQMNLPSCTAASKECRIVRNVLYRGYDSALTQSCSPSLQLCLDSHTKLGSVPSCLLNFHQSNQNRACQYVRLTLSGLA